MIEALVPEVALLDVRMQGLDGLSIVAKLRASRSRSRLLLISGSDDSQVAHEAIAQGAAGFLSKDAEEAEIAEAIVGVAAGHSVLSPALQSGVLDLIRARTENTVQLSGYQGGSVTCSSSPPPATPPPRSPDDSTCPPTRSRRYWQRLYEKLGASDRASAMAEAIRRGLLQ